MRTSPERTKVVTVSLPAREFDWLNELVTTLESAGQRRMRSGVVRVALAELRRAIGEGPQDEAVQRWLERAIDSQT